MTRKEISRIFFLSLFFSFVLFFSKNIFLNISPYSALIAVISSRKMQVSLLPGLLLPVLGIFTGRKFCWWICPYGTLHEWSGRLGKKLKFPQTRTLYDMRAGFVLLLFATGLAFFAVPAGNHMDPLVLANRLFSAFKHGSRPGMLFGAGLSAGLILTSLFSFRLWCYRFCPLGTLLEGMSFIRRRKGNTFRPDRRSFLLGTAGGLFLLFSLKKRAG
ncbi:MAG TPA: 4Fe-4S binding protein, partial [bacterium]|nr:4Fe-4S binding protein [bacterium]